MPLYGEVRDMLGRDKVQFLINTPIIAIEIA